MSLAKMPYLCNVKRRKGHTMDASDSSKTTLTTTRSIKEIITLKTNWTMKRNTLFTVMMCCMMAVVSNNMMAQGRGNHGEGRYDRNEGPGYSFSMRGTTSLLAATGMTVMTPPGITLMMGCTVVDTMMNPGTRCVARSIIAMSTA